MAAEKKRCKEMGIRVVCPLGAKIQSSVYLIEQAAKNDEKDS